MSFFALRSSSSAFCRIRLLLFSNSVFSACSSYLAGTLFTSSLAPEFSKPEMSPERMNPRLSCSKSKYFATLLFFFYCCNLWAGRGVTDMLLSKGLLSRMVSGFERQAVDYPSSL